MFEGIRTLFFGSKPLSNATAKNRLQMVLVQDRSGLTPQDMDFFKRDLIEVISKYFVIEKKNIDVEWQREDSSTALIINTPVVGRSHQVKAAVAG